MTFARSGRGSLEAFDRIVQYGRPVREARVDETHVRMIQGNQDAERSAVRARGRGVKRRGAGRSMNGSGRSRDDRYIRRSGSRSTISSSSSQSRDRLTTRRDLSRSRSRDRGDRPSYSSSRAPLRRRSPSRSPSPSREPSNRSSSTESPAPAQSAHRGGDLPVNSAIKPAQGFSIFGAALRSMIKSNDDVSSTLSIITSTETTPATPTDEANPVETIPLPIIATTALRLKLQTRLLNEYRTNIAKSNLRQKIRERLLAEKARSISTTMAAEEEALHEEYAEESPYIYTAEIRTLLLERLEEEKRNASHEVEQGSFRDEEGEDEEEEEDKYIIEDIGEVDRQKEEVLRLALFERKIVVGETSLAEKLKEKLLRERLLGMKKAVVAVVAA
jgi:hypothetical protein